MKARFMTEIEKRQANFERHKRLLLKKQKLLVSHIRLSGMPSTEWEHINLTGIIYRILNLINGKSYIGQTENWFNYRYRAGKWWLRTDNPLLKAAVVKYGLENFKVYILEFGIKSVEELNYLENKYIIEYNTFAKNQKGYNLDEGGNNRKLSEETKEKLSKAHLGKTHSQESKDKMSKSRLGRKGAMLGKTHTEETKSKLSDLNTGKNNAFYGKKHSQETKDKLSNFRKSNKNAQEHIIKLINSNIGRKQMPSQISKRAQANKKPINQIDINTGVIIKTWLSSKDAGESLYHSSSSITAVCKGKAKSAAGFFWSYA